MSSEQVFSDEEKALVVGFTDWLATKKGFDATSLEIVQQTLAEASGLDSHVPSSASIRPFTLLDVFNAGRAVLEKQRGEFDAKVLPKLQESNFFAGAEVRAPHVHIPRCCAVVIPTRRRRAQLVHRRVSYC